MKKNQSHKSNNENSIFLTILVHWWLFLIFNLKNNKNT